MSYRVCVLAAVALISSLGIAAAQSAPPRPLAAGSPEGNAVGGAAGGRDKSARIGPALVIKVNAWNTVHATNCAATVSTKGVVTITLYPSEGGSFYTTLPQIQAMLIAQCALGNWISFYVNKKINNNNFTWNEVETWDYK